MEGMPTHTPPHLCPLPLGGDFLWSVLGKQFCKYSPGIFLSHFKNPSPKKNFRKKIPPNFLATSPFSISPRQKKIPGKKNSSFPQSPFSPPHFSCQPQEYSHGWLSFVPYAHFFLWLPLYLRRSYKKRRGKYDIYCVSFLFFLLAMRCLCMLFYNMSMVRFMNSCQDVGFSSL